MNGSREVLSFSPIRLLQQWRVQPGERASACRHCYYDRLLVPLTSGSPAHVAIRIWRKILGSGRRQSWARDEARRGGGQMQISVLSLRWPRRRGGGRDLGRGRPGDVSLRPTWPSELTARTSRSRHAHPHPRRRVCLSLDGASGQSNPGQFNTSVYYDNKSTPSYSAKSSRCIPSIRAHLLKLFLFSPQAQHGRPILLLPHHLLAQVSCLRQFSQSTMPSLTPLQR